MKVKKYSREKKGREKGTRKKRRKMEGDFFF